MTVTLTGPLLFPGNDEPWAGAAVKIRLVAGSASTMAHADGTARAGTWSTTTDAAGDFSVEVPTLVVEGDTDNYPGGAYYEVVVGGGRFPKYTRKIQPTTDGTYVVTDPAITGELETLLPPTFVQVVPTFTADEVEAAVGVYLTDNPPDVSDEVDTYLAANPPLYAAQNGEDIPDKDAFRQKIGAAGADDVLGRLQVLENALAASTIADASDPMLRVSDLAADGQIADLFIRGDQLFGGPGISVAPIPGGWLISHTPVASDFAYVVTESGRPLVTESGGLLLLEP